MQTIDVGEELESFGRIGEESGMESFAPLGMSGLFLGLVYEGRDEGDGMGEKENGEEKGEMKRCGEFLFYFSFYFCFEGFDFGDDVVGHRKEES